MTVDLRLPHITATDADGKASQLHGYLIQLVRQLNWILNSKEGTTAEAVRASESNEVIGSIKLFAEGCIEGLTAFCVGQSTSDLPDASFVTAIGTVNRGSNGCILVRLTSMPGRDAFCVYNGAWSDWQYPTM